MGLTLQKSLEGGSDMRLPPFGGGEGEVQGTGGQQQELQGRLGEDLPPPALSHPWCLRTQGLGSPD